MDYVCAERLLKMSLEELRELLQERIAQTFFYSDDVIIEQLQASMTELRKMKLDLPPPGALKALNTDIPEIVLFSIAVYADDSSCTCFGLREA